MINVAVLGYGVVGSGVAEVFEKNGNHISLSAGKEIRLAKILDIRDFEQSPFENLFTKNAGDVFDNPDINIVVETIGGLGIAFEYTKRAFAAGKHVVTSNKELVAAHGPELLKMAAENGVNYLFEASVGGGIPIIRPLSQCLAANEITGVMGILNGTTNYILTKMSREAMDFEAALKGAQKKGYAERDPSADVEGSDSCRKLAILSSIAFKEFVDYKDIKTEGITQIDDVDIRYAEKLDSVIKLIAESRRSDGIINAKVGPALIKKGHPLSGVEEVYNAIVVSGNAVGETMFYGRGAGKLPTASAIIADIIDIVGHNGSCRSQRWERQSEIKVLNFEEVPTRYFVRVKSAKLNETQKQIEEIFGSPEYVTLEDRFKEGELAFISEVMAEKMLEEKISELKAKPFVLKVKRIVNHI